MTVRVSPLAACLLVAVSTARAGGERPPLRLHVAYDRTTAVATSKHRRLFEAWCAPRVVPGQTCDLDALVYPDLDVLRKRLRVPARGVAERLDVRLLEDLEVTASAIRQLHRDVDLHLALTWYATWPRSSVDMQTTCAAVFDPATGRVLGTDCHRYIVGRPAGPEVQRSVIRGPGGSASGRPARTRAPPGLGGR